MRGLAYAAGALALMAAHVPQLSAELLASRTSGHAPAASTVAVSSPARVKVGMSTAAALALVGRQPDHDVEIGAACGTLHIMSWEQSSLQIISVGGTVSSVANGVNRIGE